MIILLNKPKIKRKFSELMKSGLQITNNPRIDCNLKLVDKSRWERQKRFSIQQHVVLFHTYCVAQGLRKMSINHFENVSLFASWSI